MRQLNTEDVFLLAGLLANTDIIEEITKFYSETKNANAEEKPTAEKAGLEIFKRIIKVIDNKEAKEYLFTFLGHLKGVTPEEYAKQPFITTIKDIKELIALNNISDFLA